MHDIGGQLHHYHTKDIFIIEVVFMHKFEEYAILIAKYNMTFLKIGQ